VSATNATRGMGPRRDGGQPTTIPPGKSAVASIPAGAFLPGGADAARPDPVPASASTSPGGPSPAGALFLAVARCRCGAEFVPGKMGQVKCQPCASRKPRTDHLRQFWAPEHLAALRARRRQVPLPPMTAEQRVTYKRWRSLYGCSRDVALAEAMRQP
jgi:hypothetical protein